jgi:hypothetical protein
MLIQNWALIALGGTMPGKKVPAGRSWESVSTSQRLQIEAAPSEMGVS